MTTWRLVQSFWPAVLALTLITCSRHGNPSSVSFDTPTGTVAPRIVFKRISSVIRIPAEVATVRVRLHGAGYDTTVSFPYSAGSGTIENVPVGMATLTVDGLDAAEQVIYKGETTIEVTADSDCRPTLTVESTRPIIFMVTTPQDSATLPNTAVTISGVLSTTYDMLVFRMNETDIQPTGSNWSTNVTLDRDTNSFEFEIFDKKGNSFYDTLTVFYSEEAIDTTGPTVTVNQLADGDTVSVTPLRLIGTVSDPAGVLSVAVNGSNADLDAGTWSEEVDLSQGKNTITIIATDNTDSLNTTPKVLTVHYDPAAQDSTSPNLTLDSPRDGDTVAVCSVLVSGTASDKSNISTVTVNDSSASVDGQSWSRMVGLVEGTNPIVVVATDNSVSHNRRKDSIAVIYDPAAADTTAPKVSITKPTNNTRVANPAGVNISGTADDLSGIDSVIVNGVEAEYSEGTWTATITLASYDANTVTAVAVDSRGNRDSASINIIHDSTITDNTPPKITVTSHTKDQTVSSPSVKLELTCTDLQSGVEWVKIDGRNAVGSGSGGSYYWDTLNLDSGSNTIEIVAQDRSTNKNANTVQFVLNYQPPEPVHIRINCGGPTLGEWMADDSVADGGSSYTFATLPDTADVSNPAPRKVYETVRHMEHSYSFDVDNGCYLVRLHFYDPMEMSRAMGYIIEGRQVLSGFDPALVAGAATKALVKEFFVTVSDGNGLQIDASKGSGTDVFECGIEVITNAGCDGT